MKSRIASLKRNFAAFGFSAAVCSSLHAASITVPNYSFESQTAPTSPPYVNTFVDSWQKAPEPAYYGPAIGIPFGIPWVGTAGVFYDTNPYQNHVGVQCGYILGFPQVTLFQDYNSSPTHDFNATFEAGNSYNLTIGVFGKPTLAQGSTLQVSLYYVDAGNNHVPVGSTTITYSSAAFPTGSPLNLVDFQVNVPTVQASDAWSGQNIGIQLLSTTPLELATGGNWDFDNVRLTVVPEPASLGLLAVGLGGFMVARRSRRG
jgi:PEP-CTERM motif